MGKAARWFKGFLGMKKEKETPPANSNENDRREKRRWSFARPGKDSAPPLAQIPVNIPAESGWLRTYLSETEKEQNKHAIAVAAATAAAADAAVAAAQAAVAVVRLTSHGRTAANKPTAVTDKPSAAVKIQTVFRGYLARKALRALKGLVKLQAHVRGYLVRKQATATLRSMQALVRAQAAARSHRARRSITKDGSGRIPPEILSRRSMESEFHSKRLSSSYDPYDDTPKIVEIDTYKPNSRSSRRNSIYPSSVPDSGDFPTISSPLPPCRISIPDWGYYDDDHQCSHRVASAYSTPRYANTYRSHAPPTPAKSVCGESYHFRPYYDHHVHRHGNGHYYYPNYMTNTQSFRAKVRSQSAPRQRPAAPSPSRKRMSLNEMMAARSSVSGVRMQRSFSNVQEEALHF